MTDHSTDLVPNLIKGHKSDGRCVYAEAAKRELVRRCLQPGVSLARTALQHGINANLLRKWVTQQSGVRLPRRKRSTSPDLSTTPLLAVKTTPVLSTPGSDDKGYLELVVTGGTIRIHGRIDAQTLSVVLDCMAQRA